MSGDVVGPKLHLRSNDLLSKWGFNDGSEPDELLDYCDAQRIEYPGDWSEVLHRLVVDYLIPALDQRVEIVRVETCHNPVRADTVEGVDVTDQWRREECTQLSPDRVEIPMADVIELFHPGQSYGRQSSREDHASS